MVGEIRIGVSAVVGISWVRWWWVVRGRTSVSVDEVHEVLGFALGEGNQGHSDREGGQVPWSGEGGKWMEELGVYDTVGEC